MGASDWAGEMAGKLREEFDLSSGQALRLTTIIRWFNSNPEYAGVFDEPGSERWREQKRIFIHDLPDVLRAQSGDTLEERWNTLMDELGFQERTERGVYLESWTEQTGEKFDYWTLHPQEDMTLPGLHRREDAS